VTAIIAAADLAVVSAMSSTIGTRSRVRIVRPSRASPNSWATAAAARAETALARSTSVAGLARRGRRVVTIGWVIASTTGAGEDSGVSTALSSRKF
jgi:hypothetical protein